MDAAICATCSGECVRAFLAYGTSRSVGQISMCRAIAGVMVAGSVDIYRGALGENRADTGLTRVTTCSDHLNKCK